MAIIKAQNLTKKFKSLIAVDNVSLEIFQGECFGLLGPNGAGKTTLIRMITAVTPSTAGDIHVVDKDIRTHAREVKAILGVVPQLDNLDVDLTVLQNLITFARYFDIPEREARRHSMEILKLFQLEEKQGNRINELSGGMKRRLLIARGLVNHPEIVILDEPTIGLDPQAKYLVWHKLAELKSQGVTQLLCTQNMDEAEVLCDRVAIMYQGKILSLDTPQSLISQYIGDEVWEVSAKAGERDNIIAALKRQGLIYEEVGEKLNVFNSVDDEALLKLLSTTGKLRRRSANLEDVFFKLTGRSLLE
ncbi:ABC transporter ATP-binding protein [Chloroflexota bacterium]